MEIGNSVKNSLCYSLGELSFFSYSPIRDKMWNLVKISVEISVTDSIWFSVWDSVKK